MRRNKRAGEIHAPRETRWARDIPKGQKIQPLRLLYVCSLKFSVLHACPSSLGRSVCFALSHFSPKLETTTTVGCGSLLTINRTICGIGFSSFWSQLYIFSIKPEKARLHTSLSGIKYTLKKLIHCSFICGMISFTIQVDSSTSSTCRNLSLGSAACWRENYISHNIRYRVKTYSHKDCATGYSYIYNICFSH